MPLGELGFAVVSFAVLHRSLPSACERGELLRWDLGGLRCFQSITLQACAFRRAIRAPKNSIAVEGFVRLFTSVCLTSGSSSPIMLLIFFWTRACRTLSPRRGFRADKGFVARGMGCNGRAEDCRGGSESPIRAARWVEASGGGESSRLRLV